jgi:YaiO family outer membrane protein
MRSIIASTAAAFCIAAVSMQPALAQQASTAPAATPAPAAPAAAAPGPQPGTLGLTVAGTAYTISGAKLGPWDIGSIDYQWQADKEDIPSVTFYSRFDNDPAVKTNSQAVYVDDYHTFAPDFYMYAQVEGSYGKVNPYRMFYVEGDYKTGWENDLVLSLGGATMQNPSGAVFPFSGGTTTQYYTFGPSYYTGPFAFSLRFTPSNTNGTNTASTSFSMQYTRVGQNLAVLGVQAGTQPNVFVGAPGFPPAYAYQKFFLTSLTEKRWLTDTFGIEAGATTGYYNGGLTPANSYHENAYTLGIFLYPTH